jgi:hypothetical protein
MEMKGKWKGEREGECEKNRKEKSILSPSHKSM